MQILQATLQHLQEVALLFDQYRQFYNQPRDLEAAAAFLSARIEKNESIIFFAKIDEQTAGFIQLYPTFSSVNMQKAFILNDLYVEECFRGHGVGKALIEKCYSVCEQEQARYITLQTAPDNEMAKRLYEKMGMEINREFISYIKYF
ncbi:GNAT family N-acetyltransferase [Bacillus sp. AGMB 02131]|uniref:GNAT family N-acetyltransferase n=1 Tax=Peribacillus faecalis TaxID=2772559 RepID=A0A927CTZ5_9BACI|nr:GNAT family N-acetyltransferase [Peribacillus faecalis]MBD3106991.1 GNAT family N-acetyltransferase [Peribacillus faecalis]